MDLQKTSLLILAAAAATLLAASTIDELVQGTRAAPVGAMQPTPPTYAPADATWAGLFGANWR